MTGRPYGAAAFRLADSARRRPRRAAARGPAEAMLARLAGALPPDSGGRPVRMYTEWLDSIQAWVASLYPCVGGGAVIWDPVAQGVGDTLEDACEGCLEDFADRASARGYGAYAASSLEELEIRLAALGRKGDCS